MSERSDLDEEEGVTRIRRFLEEWERETRFAERGRSDKFDCRRSAETRVGKAGQREVEESGKTERSCWGEEGDAFAARRRRASSDQS